MGAAKDFLLRADLNRGGTAGFSGTLGNTGLYLSLSGNLMKKIDTFDEQGLLDILKKAGRPLRLDDIIRFGAFSRKLKRDILDALHDFARNGVLVRLDGGSWSLMEDLKRRRGILSVQRSGSGFVIPEETGGSGGQDI